MTAPPRPLAGAITLWVLSSVTTVLSACGGTPTDDGGTVASLSITPSSLHFDALGVDSLLVVRALDGSGADVEDVTVAWETDNQSVADVFSNGLVQPRGDGTTVITASVGGVQATIPVVVYQVARAMEITAPSVELIAIGAKQVLRVRTVDRTNRLIRGRSYEWSSFDPDVVTVDPTGTVTAISNGSTLVRAATDDVADTVAIAVQQDPRIVVISPPFSVLAAPGETVTLKGDVKDSLGVDIPGLTVEWASTDEGVATVSPQGEVTATGIGYAGVVARHASSEGIAALTIGDVDDWSGVGEWSTHQGDTGHTGYLPVFLDVHHFKASWTVTPRVGLHLNPVAIEGNDVAFVTNSLGQPKRLGVLSTETGAQRWTVDLSTIDHADPPAIADGKVFVVTRGTSTSRLLTFDAQTGDQLFVSFFDGAGAEYLAPVPVEGQLYVAGGATGGLYRFDAVTGAQDWHTPLAAFDLWTPAVSGGSAYAYIGGDSAGVWAVDPETGTVTGHAPDPGFQSPEPRLRVAPVVTRDDRLVVTESGRLVTFDLAGLSQTWALPYDHENRFEDQLAAADGSIFVVNRGGLDVRREVDGELLWSWRPPPLDNLSGSVVVTRNLVFVTSTSTLYAIHRGSHDVVWTSSSTGSLAFSADGGLFVVDEDVIARIDLR